MGIATLESELSDTKHKNFSLIAGHKNVYRYKYVTAMKRYITKAENKFVACDVDYVDNGEICNHYLDIKEAKF